MFSANFLSDKGQTINKVAKELEREMETQREAAKIKVIFLLARPLRPYPSPLELSGHIFGGIFLELKKKFLPPPTLKKNCGFPYKLSVIIHCLHLIFPDPYYIRIQNCLDHGTFIG